MSLLNAHAAVLQLVCWVDLQLAVYCVFFFFFFFNDTATTEIYTLSLHDALPIFDVGLHEHAGSRHFAQQFAHGSGDRKSTRLNSSHGYISYAVFCLKKKKTFRTEIFKPLENCILTRAGHHCDAPI